MIMAAEGEGRIGTDRHPAVAAVDFARSLVEVDLAGLAEVGVLGNEAVFLLAVDDLGEFDEAIVRGDLVGFVGCAATR